jgi:ribosome-associated protein
LLKSVCGALADKKIENVLVLDMRSLTHLTDYFVICTARTARQAQAACAFILETLKARKVQALHVEGETVGSWILLDYVDVVVHIFQPQAREYYSLESVWGDALDVSREFADA